MNDTKSTIITQAVRLAISHREIPSLNDLAQESGVSKGGLLHHFPTRQALLEAIADHGITSVDTALDAAHKSGSVLHAWLELSLPGGKDVALFQALASVFFASKTTTENLAHLVTDANERWEKLLADELGSMVAARAARLLGDGLLLGAVSGTITKDSAKEHLAIALDTVHAVVEAQR